MKQQLKAMVSDNTHSGNIDISQNLLGPVEDSPSNLIRSLSYDWDEDKIQIIETEMRKSLKFLQGQYED